MTPNLTTSQEQIRTVDVNELVQIKFKPRKPVLSPWLNSQELAMVYAPRGIGKTHFCLSVMAAIASGGRFANWQAPEPKRVLYLDGELPGGVLQQRIRMHCLGFGLPHSQFRVFTPDLLPEGIPLPDISTVEGQEIIDGLLEDAEVICIDNLSAWIRTGKENDAESWQPVADWMMRLRRRGLSVLLVHHAGKSGQQRGTSKREDLLDVVISLSRPQDYDPKQGAVFIAEFSKARHLSGGEAESIEFALAQHDEKATWTFRSAEGSTYEKVLALTRDGLSRNEICVELAINKSTVSRHLRKAQESGVFIEGNTSLS